MAKKRMHEVGKEIREELDKTRGGEIVIGYAKFRKRFGFTTRKAAPINQCRKVLARDHGVYFYPDVDGKELPGRTHEWGSYSDRRTRVVLRLRGAASGNRPSTGKAARLAAIDADADIWVIDENRMQVIPADGKHPRPLHNYQEEAVQQLTNKMTKGSSTVLVLPTGGGKTRTAVHWLLENVIDKGHKVLWLAHRHELINQACNAFCQSAYRGDNLRSRDHFICRKISGRHSRPFAISADDDVLVASVYSVGRSHGLKWLREKWLCTDDPVVLVVDEAHHAPAPTYRKVIGAVRESRPNMRMLGLTATPYRTAKGEQGLMKQMFPDDIAYTVDIHELIRKRILAEPCLEDVPTGVDFQLDEKTIDRLIRTRGQFGTLEKIADELEENSKRNNLIAEHYVKGKYGRTIIFALNVNNAIALTKLLKKRRVRADYVVSDVQDVKYHVRVDPERNQQVVKRFKRKELDVLVNVNILTEGFDDPSVQTVFLTRPTMSTIMMMQMVGRALRGPKVGGTKTANIVSFIDDWADRIRWTSPSELIAREEAEFAETPQQRRKSIRKLVLISLIENYAAFLDSRLGENIFGNMPFVERIPVGLYVASMLEEGPDAKRNSDTDSDVRQTADILVFAGAESALNRMLKEVKPKGIPRPGTKKFEEFVARTMKRYFTGLAGLPIAPREQDVRTLLGHMEEHRAKPTYYPFEQREDYDVTRLAREICKHDMGPRKKMEYLKKHWDKDPDGWQRMSRGDFSWFERVVSEKVSKLSLQEFRVAESPRVVHGKKRSEECSLSELYEKRPDEWKRIQQAVYDDAYDKRTRKYQCAETGWRSARRNDFEIDHIRPRAEGGKTTLDNLRLVRRHENARKGVRWSDRMIQST